MTTTTPTTAKSPAQARLAASPAPARHEEIRRTAPNVAPRPSACRTGRITASSTAEPATQAGAGLAPHECESPSAWPS